MGYTNSPLVSCKVLSPNHSGQRTHSIDTITPHCVEGQLSAESIGSCFPKNRPASCNYGIGKDGRVVLIVEEKNRSWCSSSSSNDQRAVTIECASELKPPYEFNTTVYNKLIDLCVDICQRNGKTKLLWLGTKDKTLNYSPKSNEMLLTVHRWFASKSCPGDWLMARMDNLADSVTAKLKGNSSSKKEDITVETYRVRKTWKDADSQIGAYTSLANAKKCADENSGYKVFNSKGDRVYPFKPYQVKVDTDNLRIRTSPKITADNFTGKYTGRGVFKIVEEKNGWGLLEKYKKKRNGWIYLEYTNKI